MLGKVVKIDYNTTVGRRGKFARFALVVDLLKPLKAFVRINGIPYCVKCKGLPLISYKCGHYGYAQGLCPLVVTVTKDVQTATREHRPTLPSVEEIKKGESNFGTWM